MSKRMGDKVGQSTLFIIVGILIVLLVSLTYYFYSDRVAQSLGIGSLTEMGKAEGAVGL